MSSALRATGSFSLNSASGVLIDFAFLALQSDEVSTSLFASSAAPRRLGCYVSQLPDVFNTRRVTLHGLRSGCAISLALAGAGWMENVRDNESLLATAASNDAWRG